MKILNFTKKFLRNNNCLLVLSLILMFVGTLFAGLIQSDFGNVKIVDITIQTDVGTLTGYLLVPEHEKGEKLPAVVTSHGYLNNREMQDLNYIELSRNGFVVFAMNAFGHGESSVISADDKKTVSGKSGGMVNAVEFLATLPYVDITNIGVTGHSMGGEYANKTMQHYTSLERAALAKGESAEDAKALNKIKAGMIIGNFPVNLVDVEATDGSMGYLNDVTVLGGKYDEFYYNMTGGVYPKDLLASDTLKKVIAVQTGETITGAVASGTEFTNAQNGYTFTMHLPGEFHAQNHFSVSTVDLTVTFFNDKLTTLSDTTPRTQTWWVKEMFNLVGLIGMFMFIVPFAKLMMQTPFFSTLKADSIPALPALLNKKVKRKFYGANIGNSLTGCLLTMPFVGLGFLLVMIMGSSFFPQEATAGFAVWSLACGLASLLFLRISNGKFKGKGVELGFIVKKSVWLKTVLLSIIVVATTYSMVFLADYAFNVDFRLWTFAVRVFSFDKLLVALRYLPFFIVFYVVNSMCLSRYNFENWTERKQIFAAIGFNTLGLIVFLLISYVPVLFSGLTMWAIIPIDLIQAAGTLLPILVLTFVPILAIAGYLNVKLYKATGNVWLGGLVNAILITLLTVANTGFSFPY